ncbi:MAG: transporter substrate-binding domain-containing protein [Chloroflexi bacterium]|nr:transporter substrate-binding domain-containing protein [Chloroflexota bacterium]
MDRSRSLLDRAAIIPIAACALLFGSTLGVTAQSPDASMDAASMAPATSMAPAVIGPECAKDALALKNPGRLTLSTDNPAFPPWWSDADKPADSDWGFGYPANGMGYEGATAAAIAAALGFTPAETDWIPNTVFENAFAPGPKPFDFHLAQISIRPERAEAIDFSDPYFDSHQAILSMTYPVGAAPDPSAGPDAASAIPTNPIVDVTTAEGLKAFKLGAAVGTTSFALIEDVIQPTSEAQVFNDNAAALQALQNGQIDGLVVDVQTALFMRDAQLENFDTAFPEATIVGQFDELAQENQMGIVLDKDSALTACVNEALAVITSDGTLQSIYDQWISTGQDIQTFQ